MSISKTEFFEAMDKKLQAVVPSELRNKGWIYWDMYKKPSPEVYGQLLDTFTDGEYQVLIATNGKHNDGQRYIRAQFLLSPIAVKNLDDNPELKALVR